MERASLNGARRGCILERQPQRLDDGRGTASRSICKAFEAPPPRPTVRGKFLFLGQQKFYVCGVSYDAVRADEQDNEPWDRARIDGDFAQMAASGINTVRMPHTAPPPWLLDIARARGLRVIVNLSADRYLGYLVEGKRASDMFGSIRAQVRRCAGHPAVLCYALGDEISSELVRRIGSSRVERFLRELHRLVKSEDPEGLVTYVSRPATEDLRLPFLDFVSFNVHLDDQAGLEASLTRLQTIADERPLLVSALRLESSSHDREVRARALDSQLGSIFACGAAGAVVLSWMDRELCPKPPLRVLASVYAPVPFAARDWPRISVVVCSHNGSRTVDECMRSLMKLAYPNFEVIVVDDGSTDGTAEIVRDYPVQLVQTENRGLSSARNLGMELATGEIIAYTDDDAYPDPHWLQYLAHTFLTTNFAAVGGPNFPPAGDGLVADAVANAPGGPTHVLLSEREAEHIPGCNIAFLAERLRAIGGFDPEFRAAGDDVDVCWRIQQVGWKIGFNHAAVVWHHRRKTLRTYWKQQAGYGEAEAMLRRKWPDKYNAAGHVVWGGRVYARGGYPLVPEWYFVLAALAALAVVGAAWRPLVWALPLFLAALGATLGHALLGAARPPYRHLPRSRMERWRLRSLTMVLHLFQPLARLVGRYFRGAASRRVR